MTEQPAPYHHGDLANALMRAGREILQESGVEGLSLRAVTRRAGVSATAAVPHFGNLAGLRAALAAEGYRELTRNLTASQSPHSAGLAYIAYARANPDLFRLMFRGSMLEQANEALSVESNAAFEALRALAEGGGGQIQSGSAARMAALWGRVHGLALLAIDDMLAPLLAASESTDLACFLEEALQAGGESRA